MAALARLGKYKMPDIILASSSPRRQIILKQTGLPFKVVTPDVDESTVNSARPSTLVKKLALLKAQAVRSKFPDDTIISADTVVCHNGQILGKPKDLSHARQMLRSLSGNTHCVHTGVCVYVNGKRFLYSVKSKVTFEDISDEFIEQYISKYPVLDKAGAYGVQQGAFYFIRQIKGEIGNVVGLPTKRLKRILKSHKQKNKGEIF